MKVRRIHHLTLAVRDVEKARATFSALFGEAADPAVDVAAFGVRASEIPLGDSTLQLAAPISPEGALMRFIERKGEGFYTLALEVDDLTEAIAELSAQGVRVSAPVEATPGQRSAFVTMAATHGLSIQLIESPERESAAASDEEPLLPGTPAPPAVLDESPVMPHGTSSAAAPPPTLDLTPDEWSDTD